MKSIFTSIIALAIISTAGAQKAPVTHEFEVEGVKVILRESVKGTVSARLFVLGGTANYSQDEGGLENMALSLAMQSGPESMTKQEFNAATEKIGAEMGASSGYDYSNMSLNCVRPYWDRSWALFSQAIVNPAFRQDEFEILKQQVLTASKQRKSNPDAHLSEMAMGKAWEGTNYAKVPSGSPESIEAITLQSAKKHYNEVVTKKNIFLVVVGDIKKDDLMSKAKDAFASLPEGKAPPKLITDEKISKGLYVEDRQIETNYIKGQFDAPEKGTDESIHNALAFSILYNRFFEELRTKRSLSYAPAARSTGYIARPMNEVYISTTDPKKSLEVMMDELNKAKTEGFTSKELKGKKQSFLTRHYMGQESNSSISMTLGRYEIYGGWKMADQFTDKVLGTDLKDINQVVQNYGDEIYWTYLGKEDMVSPDDFKQPKKPEKMKK